DEAPFEAARKARAAAAAQPRGLDLLGDRARLHLERLAERLVAARFPVAGDREHLRIADVSGQHLLEGHYFNPRAISAADRGVRFSWESSSTIIIGAVSHEPRHSKW